MNNAERRNQIIDRVARSDKNEDRVCMAVYVDRNIDLCDALCIGTEFEGKSRTIAMRAYERTPR